MQDLLNIQFIERDTKPRKGRFSRPNQFGITCISIEKNVVKLVDNGYTIILFEQKRNKQCEIERVFFAAYTPGTCVSDRHLTENNNYIMTIYIEEHRQLKHKNILVAIGITITDLSTGDICIHEFCNNNDDERLGLDEIVRMMEMYRPIETVIYYHPIKIDHNYITNMKEYMELEKYPCMNFYIYHDKKGQDKLNLIDENTFKISNQNNILSKIFKLNSQVELNAKKSPIEYLGLEQKSYAVVSLLIMINFISEHNTLLLKNLSVPNIYEHDNHLVLGNNALEQLNIIDSNNLESYNKRFESLFSVVNRTSTPMGKRLLKQNLANPLSKNKKNTLIKRYNIIEGLLNDDFYKKIMPPLSSIKDMERLHRKMSTGSMTPYDFYKLDVYNNCTMKILNEIIENKNFDFCISKNQINDFYNYQKEYNTEFCVDFLKNHNNFNNIESSFFKPNIHPKIDELQNKIDYAWILINSTKQYLTDLISDVTVMKNPSILKIT